MGNDPSKQCTTKAYCVGKPPGLVARDDAWTESNAVAVCVVKAQKLKPQDLNGSSDPYVRAKVVHEPLGEQEQRTSVVFKDLNPVWSPPDVLVFHYTPGNAEAQIRVSVFDWDLRTADEYSGYFVLDVEALRECKNEEMVIPLIDPSDGHESTQSLTLRVTHLTGLQAMSFQEDYVFEFERHSTTKGWRAVKKEGDPGSWCCGEFSKFGDGLEDVAPAVTDGWQVSSSWGYFRSAHDGQGWLYSNSHDSPRWAKSYTGAAMRRRVWRRVSYDASRISAEELPVLT